MLSDILRLIFMGMDNHTDESVLRALADAFDAQLGQSTDEPVLLPESEEDGANLWRSNYDGPSKVAVHKPGLAETREAGVPDWLVSHSIDLIAYAAQHAREVDDHRLRVLHAINRKESI